MKDNDGSTQWLQDTVPVPDTDDLQQQIILQARMTPQKIGAENSLLAFIMNKVSTLWQQGLTPQVAGVAVAMTAVVVFFTGDFLSIEETNVSPQAQIISTSELPQDSELEEEMDWDTYFMLETEMVMALL